MRTGLALILGFLLLASPAAARDTYRSGSATLTWDHGTYDFDGGVRSPAHSRVDVGIEGGDCDQAMVLPVLCTPPVFLLAGSVFYSNNTSRISSKRSAKPAYQTCRGLSYPKSSGGGSNADGDGAWYCIRTSAGRFGRVRITHWATASEAYVKMNYLVWR